MGKGQRRRGVARWSVGVSKMGRPRPEEGRGGGGSGDGGRRWWCSGGSEVKVEEVRAWAQHGEGKGSTNMA